MTTSVESLMSMTAEDAYAFMASLIHDHMKVNQLQFLGRNGFDLYLPSIVDKYLPPEPGSGGSRPLNISGRMKENVYRSFFDAAWQMCLSGLLRPNSAAEPYNGHQMGHGDVYSFTSRGFEWFKNGDLQSVVLTTGRIGQLLNDHSAKFGDGYSERAQQAVLCHNARAFLACCVMSGAAAESILLTVAIAKEKDEAAVMTKYRAQSGRRAIEKLIFDGKKDGFISPFKSGLELLKYWRDESAHGAASNFDDVEATVALNHLLRLAQLADQKWTELTT